MSDAQAAARGQRAALCGEFITPILEETRNGYLSRIAEIAATELNPKVRGPRRSPRSALR
jgi:cell division protein FtsL